MNLLMDQLALAKANGDEGLVQLILDQISYLTMPPLAKEETKDYQRPPHISLNPTWVKPIVLKKPKPPKPLDQNGQRARLLAEAKEAIQQ